MHRRATAYRIVRIGRRIPQYEFAAITHIDPARLSKIERGLVRASNEELDRITQALGVDALEHLAAADAFLDSLEAKSTGTL